MGYSSKYEKLSFHFSPNSYSKTPLISSNDECGALSNIFSISSQYSTGINISKQAKT